MVGRLIRFILTRGAETLFALGLVLGFFLVFMGLLSLSFPQGTSLGDLMRSGEFADVGERALGSRFDIAGGAPAEGEPFIAVLSHTHRSVKDKPSNAIAWTDARAGRKLGDYHAVQTFDRSRATITFTESSALTLNENSLIILKSTESDPVSNARRASLIVMDGELRGTIAVSDREKVSLEIEAATKSARIRSDARPGAPAEFTVRVNEGKSSTFSVLAGSAEVSSERGSMVIEMNHAVTVNEAGALGRVVSLPPSPSLLSPKDGARRRIRSSRARLTFRWSEAPGDPVEAGADGSEGSGGKCSYVISVARDRKFQDIFHRETVTRPEYTLVNFKAVRYYWHVCTRRGTLKGPARSHGRISEGCRREGQRDSDRRRRARHTSLHCRSGGSGRRDGRVFSLSAARARRQCRRG
jgi:hypothetical protein